MYNYIIYNKKIKLVIISAKGFYHLDKGSTLLNKYNSMLNIYPIYYSMKFM